MMAEMKLVLNTRPIEHLLRIVGKHMVQAADELAQLRFGDFEDPATLENFRAWVDAQYVREGGGD